MMNSLLQILRSRLRLKFDDPSLERAYQMNLYLHSLPWIRFGLGLSLALFSFIAFLDPWMVPRTQDSIWIIRFGIVSPYIILAFAATYVRRWAAYMQFFLCFTLILFGIAVLLMIAISDSGDPGSMHYYAGLVLVILGAHSLFRLNFFYATFASFLLIFGYEYVAIVHQDSLKNWFHSNEGLVFLNNNFFLISANFIGMTVSYSIEFYFRSNFLQRKRIVEEQQRAEELLLNILPQSIALRLKEQQSVIADNFDCISVLFADIVGFTALSKRLPAVKLVTLLNQIFSIFDGLVAKHEVEKIKTIGDAYMVAGGVPIAGTQHMAAIAALALDMQIELARFNRENNQAFDMRIGMHVGPAVAGVIGTKKFIYDIWGVTVNIASRMESHGIAGQIQVSEEMYACLKDEFAFKKRGLINVKGKGKMLTYLLLRKGVPSVATKLKPKKKKLKLPV